MEENFQNVLEHLLGASEHLKAITETVEKMYLNYHEPTKDTAEKETKDNKVKVTIKVKNPFKEELEGLSDEEIEQIRKDLEEIINDFTRE